MRYPSAVLSFITGPIRIEKSGDRNILTHLQKYSHFGFMVTWPFCFHIWIMPTPQEQRADGTWVPGTESGFYARTPGFRWDTDLGMKWTWGYIGGHWD